LLLTAAVIYLAFRLTSTPAPAPRQAGPAGDGEPDIVFVNTDTLLNYYPYYDALNEAFKRKQDSLEKILSSRASAIERDAQAYQDKAAGMLPQQRQETEEKLYKRQQDLVEFRKKALSALSDDEETMMDQLHQDLAREIREYNAGRYRFILGFQRGSGILFADSARDITREVVEAIKGEQ
jgi:outer membrane protein